MHKLHHCDVARHAGRLEPLTRLWSGLADTLGLVIDGWVEVWSSDDFAGGGVDGADVLAVVAEGEFAVRRDSATNE